MQTVIYADVLVALNTVLTYLLLCAASAVSRVPNRTGGTVAASLLGGASALIVFVDLPAAASVLYRIGTAALLTFLAFLPKKPKPFIKAYAAFFGAGFLFGGAMLAVEWAFHPSGMIYRSGAIYCDVNIVFLLGVSLAVYGLLLVAEHFLRWRTARGDLCEATLWLRGSGVRLVALCDSGNTLRDPLTGRSVCIGEANALAPLFTPEELRYLRASAVGDDIPPSLGRRLHLVPCRTVGGNTLLKAVVCDRLDVTEGRGTYRVARAAVAVSPRPLGTCELLLSCETKEESI